MQKKTKKLIGIISDLHFKENLPYSEYIKDGRKDEEKDVLNFIFDSLKNCQKIVFVGDIFHNVNPSATVVKKAVNFIERFEDKELFIISGNHDKTGSGKSSLDFLNEVKNKKHWHIITNEILKVNNNVYCPYFSRVELGADDNDTATKKLMKMIDTGNVLFVHHAINKTSAQTEFFNEIVLPKDKLEKKFNLIVAGHIHKPYTSGKTIVTGNIFTHEVGEETKYVFKLNEDTLEVEQIKLPVRSIYKLEDPTDADLNKIKKNSIVKVIITKKLSAPKLEELKEKLKKFDAYILLEQVPHERKRAHYDKDDNLLEMELPELLGLYAKEKDVDIKKLLKGFKLIK